MRIGVLELQGYRTAGAWDSLEHFFSNKQSISLTPQAISYWCRSMGHQVYYATYPGFGDPKSKLPDDLDIVFIATHTLTAPLAYGLCKLYRRAGTRTVLGGPHARSYPQDSLRYADLVVLQCDRVLIEDIVRDLYPPGTILSSQSPYLEMPLIEERLPELKTAAFFAGRPHPGTIIPLLSSLGCPYSCDFCMDWNNPYTPLSRDRLLEDLKFASEKLPGVKLGFLDPNFAIRFDEVMAVLECIPPHKRNPYGFQSSLNTLHPDRLERLKDTRCVIVLPSIESWTASYSNKLGIGRIEAGEKLNRVVERFQVLREYVPYIGTNLIFGLDHDSGPDSFELTKEFLLRTPFVYSTLHIPLPFGGTPMFDTFRKERRILETLPFSFYQIPYMTILFKQYDPIMFMEYMVDLFAVASSNTLLRLRFASEKEFLVRATNLIRTITAKKRHQRFSKILHLLKTDPHFLAFHRGETGVLPEYYAAQYRRLMGKYEELLPLEEATRHDFSPAPLPDAAFSEPSPINDP